MLSVPVRDTEMGHFVCGGTTRENIAAGPAAHNGLQQSSMSHLSIFLCTQIKGE